MLNNINAFADEFGNSSFDFKTQGSHFIIAAVICKEENLAQLRERIDEIRKVHNFQTGEIKSKNVAKDHKRRIRILTDIAALDINVYAVVVDKRELKGKGFSIKKSFYKYLNSLLYKELYRTYPNLSLHVDEHGGNDFMIEFKKYVSKIHQWNLFSGSDFHIQDSKQSYFIQLADFIAGTLGYVYDETKKSEYSPIFEKLLRPITSSISIFPSNYSFKELQDSNLDSNFDPKIAEVCYLRIQTFLEKETGTDQQKVDQINFLKLLLLFQRANIRNSYLSTQQILNHLNHSRKEKLKEVSFRSKVVGNLRDNGILIASSVTGYKIPTCSEDLDKFINHGKSIVLPMLHRLKQAREAVKLATLNDLDILDKESFIELKSLLDKQDSN